MPQAYDHVAGRFFDLPDGWIETDDRSNDLARDDGSARVIMTGPNGRYVAQQWTGRHWISVCKPGARSNSYFAKAASAIAHADRYTPRKPSENE